MDPVAITGWLVLVPVTGATVTFLWRMRRRGGPIALVAAGTLGFGTGLITVRLAAGHIFGVLTVELGRTPIRYDFRVYSLLLLAGILTVLGTRLAAAAAGVARGERAAWRRGNGGCRGAPRCKRSACTNPGVRGCPLHLRRDRPGWAVRGSCTYRVGWLAGVRRV